MPSRDYLGCWLLVSLLLRLIFDLFCLYFVDYFFYLFVDNFIFFCVFCPQRRFRSQYLCDDISPLIPHIFLTLSLSILQVITHVSSLRSSGPLCWPESSLSWPLWPLTTWCGVTCSTTGSPPRPHPLPW